MSQPPGDVTSDPDRPGPHHGARGVGEFASWAPQPQPVPAGTRIAVARVPGERRWHVDLLADACSDAADAGVDVVATGPFAPAREATMRYGAPVLVAARQARHHRLATGAVHRRGAILLLNVQHAGLRAPAGLRVGPSGSSMARVPAEAGLRRVVRTHARCAELADEGGYDGLLLDATRASLLGQFLDPDLNRRRDGWGGPVRNRVRLLVETVGAMRSATQGRLPLLVRLDEEVSMDPADEAWQELAEVLAGAGATTVAQRAPDGVLVVKDVSAQG